MRVTKKTGDPGWYPRYEYDMFGHNSGFRFTYYSRHMLDPGKLRNYLLHKHGYQIGSIAPYKLLAHAVTTGLPREDF